MSTGDCAVRGTIAGLSGMTEAVVNPMTVRLYPLAAEHVAAVVLVDARDPGPAR
ncbi:hypothetical protein JOF56_009720 [Kibdelosporangium banguiense]|uniref:Uncharacterized protein n=1 Tax=Kibdelosporangium banguiense TaxID=1365924 RepID=A0ABS4TY51_9PSEU|nr:hypothetical protein [Kibdelosporangium banguiense]MBP2329335.1 hypothetical protein [Kibdelosporangium banguiense]